MGNGFPLTTLLVLAISFLAAFGAALAFSLILPGGPFGPPAPPQGQLQNVTQSPEPNAPNASGEINVSAPPASPQWRPEDMERTQLYWGGAKPIAITGMARSGRELSITFSNPTEQNITLLTLNISGNTGEIAMAIAPGEVKSRSFQSEGECSAGDYRLYWVSFNYTLGGRVGEFQGELPYITQCV